MKLFALKAFVLSAAVCALVTCPPIALADIGYQCGKTPQDTPCKNSTLTKPIGRSTVPVSLNPVTAKASPNNVANATTIKNYALSANTSCKQRGEIAKEIANLRDARQSEAQQLNATSDIAMQSLIKDIYSRRGSSLQVQYHIERECIQLKEKDRLTQKQTVESERLRNGGVMTTKTKLESSPQFQTEVADVAEKPAQIELVQAVRSEPAIPITKNPKPVEQPLEPADELGICRAFKAGLENLAGQRRNGGDAAYMNDLKQQQEHLTHEMQSAGC